ncbi:HCL088Cp [Eremothecium sinecaudum]|uniref:HCL088Cp n=1 Tax=Eremothecium sinecaudum TaxID=45286 RepID=A0A0X8HRG2_9SACH|nr:HCL088Cp [Eremothecium sinecaudum]AMD20063.1 HCL088Cp [Eremothecium sinecaudum]
MNQTPEVIRVKRRRDEDSLQALLLEEKRSNKKGKYVFKLSKTVDFQSEEDTPLLQLSENDKDKVFILEQPKAAASEEPLPLEITEMLENYLKLNDKQPSSGTIKKPRRRYSNQPTVTELPSLDYVYDIYIREIVSEDEFVFDKGTVGYIRIVEDLGASVLEPEEVSDSQQLSDDEDSNDEDYYRNDYPEDEDDDRSILFGSDSENDEQNTDNSVLVLEQELEEIQDPMQPSEDYEPLFNTLAAEPNLLSSLNTTNYVDLDVEAEQDEYNEQEYYQRPQSDIESFERHQFSPTDEDDPIAIHRDRVMSKLQRMMNDLH